MLILQTERLRLRWFTTNDAAFILQLLNEPSWIANIGQRNVHTLTEAETWTEDRLIGNCKKQGFGFWAVERRSDGLLVGMCGLVKRDTLPAVDVGYAYLPAYWGQGYAREAAAACLRYGVEVLDLSTILAITSPTNGPSARVLDAIGLKHLETRTLEGEDKPTRVFGWSAPAAAPLNDQQQIERLLSRFFAAFGNRDGAIPTLAAMPHWLLPQATIGNVTPDGIKLMDLQSFVQPRAKLLFTGSLREFEERITEQRLRISGRIAQVWLRYAKSGQLDSQAFEGAGTKSAQLLKTEAGWKIASLVWQDD